MAIQKHTCTHTQTHAHTLSSTHTHTTHSPHLEFQFLENLLCLHTCTHTHQHTAPAKHTHTLPDTQPHHTHYPTHTAPSLCAQSTSSLIHIQTPHTHTHTHAHPHAHTHASLTLSSSFLQATLELSPWNSAFTPATKTSSFQPQTHSPFTFCDAPTFDKCHTPTLFHTTDLSPTEHLISHTSPAQTGDPGHFSCQ